MENRPSVLVIEDDCNITKFYETLIRALVANVRIISCLDAQAALDVLATTRPDLVMLDLSEATPELHQALEASQAQVVVASGDRPIVERIKEAHPYVREGLVKPIDFKTLKATVSEVFSPTRQ